MKCMAARPLVTACGILRLVGSLMAAGRGRFLRQLTASQKDNRFQLLPLVEVCFRLQKKVRVRVEGQVDLAVFIRDDKGRIRVAG